MSEERAEYGHTASWPTDAGVGPITSDQGHRAIGEILRGEGTWFDIWPADPHDERKLPVVALDGRLTAEQLRRIADVLDRIKPG